MVEILLQDPWTNFVKKQSCIELQKDHTLSLWTTMSEVTETI